MSTLKQEELLDELAEVLWETKRAFQRLINYTGGSIRTDDLMMKKINAVLAKVKS